MKLKPGDKVTYIPDFGDLEKDIVKEVRDDGAVFIVYHCTSEWDRYQAYTAARTSLDRLVPGWKRSEI